MDRRSAARRGRREEAVAADAAAMPAASPHHGGERTGLARALAGVPPDVRHPFLLHHLLGFSFAEIAARLGIELGAAKVRSSRARLRLRALLTGGPDGR
jgi:DNA-directed RNA polymerase specialized sigma24 family protein